MNQLLLTRLLSERPGMSVQEKEQILKRVLRQISIEEVSAVQPALSPGFSKWRLALAATALLALLPIAIFLLQPGSQSELTAKGDGQRPPSFSVTCIHSGESATCRRGEKLAFKLRPLQHKPYFSAFARRTTDGLVIWYFPSPSYDKSYHVQSVSGEQVLPHGVEIGTEHRAGHYDIYGLFSAHPLSRNAIREIVNATTDPSRATVSISKVQLEVLP